MMNLSAGLRKRTLFLWLPVCVLILTAAIWGRVRGTPPTDIELVKQFYEHQRELEKLRTMFQEDRLIMVITSQGVGTNLPSSIQSPEEIGFSRNRYNNYLTIMKGCGTTVAIHDIRKNEIRFLVAGFGFGGEGWRISFTWRDNEPERRVSNLYDFHKRHSRPGDVVYRHIEGYWYLQLIE